MVFIEFGLLVLFGGVVGGCVGVLTLEVLLYAGGYGDSHLNRFDTGCLVSSDCELDKLCEPASWFDMIEICKKCGKLR